MKTIKFKHLLILFAGLTLTQSCGLSVDISKRKHRSGYYVSIQKEDKYSSISKVSNPKQTEINELQTPILLSTRTTEKLQSEPESLFKSSFETNLNTPLFESNRNTLSNTADFQKHKKQISTVKKSESQHSNFLSHLFFGALFSSLLVFKLFKKKSKNLMFWANKNKLTSRWIIALGQITLGIVAFASGLLSDAQHLSLKMGLALSGVVMVHLIKKNISRLGNILFQKLKYFVYTLSLLGLLHVGGAYQQQNQNFNNFGAKAQEVVNTLEVKRDKKSEKSGDDAATIILKILLSILVAAGLAVLLYIIFILSCSLYCNGALALAALVGIGGLIGIILLGVFLFLLIWKRSALKLKEGKKLNGWSAFLLLLLTFGLIALLTVNLNQ